MRAILMRIGISGAGLIVYMASFPPEWKGHAWVTLIAVFAAGMWLTEDLK